MGPKRGPTSPSCKQQLAERACLFVKYTIRPPLSRHCPFGQCACHASRRSVRISYGVRSSAHQTPSERTVARCCLGRHHLIAHAALGWPVLPRQPVCVGTHRAAAKPGSVVTPTVMMPNPRTSPGVCIVWVEAVPDSDRAENANLTRNYHTERVTRTRRTDTHRCGPRAHGARGAASLGRHECD